MKKTLFFSAIALGLGFSSCTNELEDCMSVSQETITANMPEAVSRTTTDQLQVLWSEDDLIGVFKTQAAGSTNYVDNCFELTSGAGSTSAKFYASSSSGETKTLAYYPYSDGSSYDGSKLKLTIPASQNYSDNCQMVMAGTFEEGSSAVSFKNAMALAVITINNIPTGYTKAVLTAGESEKLNGVAEVTFTNEGQAELKLATSNESGTNTLTIEFGNDDATTTSKTFYFAIPVGTYASGLKLTLEGDNMTSKEIGHLKTTDSEGFTATANEFHRHTKTLGDEVTSEGKISSIDDLTKAFENGGEYTLTTGLTLSTGLTLASGKEVTLDLDGNTLTVNANNAIRNAGTLTISGGKIVYTGGNIAYSAIYNSGNITLTNVDVESDAICFSNIGSWTSNTTLQNQGEPSVTATINGGTFTSSATEHATDGKHAYAVTVMDNAKLIMSGAIVSGDGGIDIDCAHAELSNVTATHTCSSTAGLYVTACEVTIDDDCSFDSFYAYDVASQGYGATVINGVTYSGSQSLVTVSTADDLQTALTTGKSVVLISDVELTSSLSVPAGTSATLNLSKNTLTINTGSSRGIDNAGTLSISNGDVKHSSTSNNIAHSAIYNSGVITLTDVNVESNAICIANFGSWDTTQTLENQATPSVIATINGGTYTSTVTEHATDGKHAYAVTVMDNAKLIMSNAEVSGDGGINVDCAHADLKSVKATHTCTTGANGLYVTACVVTYDDDCEFDSVYAYVVGSTYGATKVNDGVIETSGVIE